MNPLKTPCYEGSFNIHSAKILWLDHTKKKKNLGFDILTPDVFWGFLGK